MVGDDIEDHFGGFLKKKDMTEDNVSYLEVRELCDYVFIDQS